MGPLKAPAKLLRRPPFDVEAFLDSGGVAGTVVAYRRGEVIYSRGDPCDKVFYIQKGGVKLRALSHTGKEAIVATLGRGDFFGEATLTGQPVHLASATATSASALLVVEKGQMIRLLHKPHALSDRFLVYVVARNFRIESALVDRVFTSGEIRLARTLLFLARYGKQDAPHRVLPTLSEETLAKMAGSTRSRVNVNMKKFNKLGYVAYDGGLRINDALLSIVLHE